VWKTTEPKKRARAMRHSLRPVLAAGFRIVSLTALRSVVFTGLLQLRLRSIQRASTGSSLRCQCSPRERACWGGVCVGMQVSGVFGVLSLPLAMGLTYLMYVAPLSRIPAALAAAWRGDRDATVSPPPIKVRASPARRCLLEPFVALHLAA
jgi:hypothetical protein